ncbi:putative Mg2+ transporter-C (MgtC) family protein [Microbacterium resistens]|uniref:Mg2+ transporter-C (MgtC) family protein n=1 Tax=Microbacterium resistens TaxID=156977 RepID=A0ABU1SGP0_9MICO|nr:MgtC/SapB family protein [Microbacterium resistens]MDR6868133.1 putative Mg2+ transporter-C (MgtC) family protein [Microbacterium resistens]
MADVAWVGSTTLTELFLLLIAFVLSAIIGLERQRRLKSAGLRTHTLVGVGSAVFTLVSAYGFATVTSPDALLDPSRIAAQVVSGIGFLGAGVIFVRQNAVSGLTTAASIWVTAAIGMASGAGMPLIAITATALHLCTVTFLGRLGRRLRPEGEETTVVVKYLEGNGALSTVLGVAADLGFQVHMVGTRHIVKTGAPPRAVTTLRLRDSSTEVGPLIAPLGDIPGVLSVKITGTDPED